MITSIENVAHTMINGVDIVVHALHAVSVLIGIVLWVMAIGLWRAHRYNPKYVPLDKPLIYILLGFILIGVPFVNKLFGPTASGMDSKQQVAVQQQLDIDAPLVLDVDAPSEGSMDTLEEE